MCSLSLADAAFLGSDGSFALQYGCGALNKVPHCFSRRMANALKLQMTCTNVSTQDWTCFLNLSRRACNFSVSVVHVKLTRIPRLASRLSSLSATMAALL